MSVNSIHLIPISQLVQIKSKCTSGYRVRRQARSIDSIEAFDFPQCSDSTAPQFILNECWHPFLVNFRLRLRPSSLAGNENLDYLKQIYTQIFLNELESSKDGNVLLYEINDPVISENIYLDVQDVEEACDEYQSVNMQRVSTTDDDCLNSINLTDIIYFNMNQISSFQADLNQNMSNQGRRLLVLTVIPSLPFQFY